MVGTGAGGQALVLVAATTGAGIATVALADRGRRATAEAVGVVAAALVLAATTPPVMVVALLAGGFVIWVPSAPTTGLWRFAP